MGWGISRGDRIGGEESGDRGDCREGRSLLFSSERSQTKRVAFKIREERALQVYNRYNFYTHIDNVEFEFDDPKSRSNLAKHGINFVDAQRLGADIDRIEIPARTEDEPRFLVIGKIDRQCWSAIITYRGNRVRIISVRRSRKEEVAIYESNRI